MLDCTTSRHFCIPLNSNKLEECAFVINKSIKDELIKIHEQFAHPSKAKFKSLLVDANMWNEEYSDFANELYEKCEICHGFKVTPPRPVASLSLTNDFNDAVAIDLKHWKNNLYILYMVDIFTKFTLASLRIKHRAQLSIQLFKCGLVLVLVHRKSFLKTMAGYLRKNGLGMCENLNIQVLNTAAESP